MSEQATNLADQFTQAADAFLTLIREASDEQLARTCPGDGWPIVLTAFHISTGYRVQNSWIRRMAAGEAIAATRDQIDAGNAQMASDPTAHPRAEV